MTMSNPDANTGGRDFGGNRARKQLLDATQASEQRLMLAGISTAVLIGGDGPPIVLLHGPGEFALAWLRVMPELMRTHRVIVVTGLPCWATRHSSQIGYWHGSVS